MHRSIAAVLLILAAQSAAAQSIPLDEASKVFAVARDINVQDGGKLWGMPICGPLIFADSGTHEVVANQPDKEGKLAQKGSVWVGKLPNDVTPANTATNWAGVHWTMLMWPLPGDPRDQRRLLAHECFHRIQGDLKLSAADTLSGHLDTRDGRIWLQLEWRALERALMESGEARRRAISDALRFRGYRRGEIKSAAAKENALEINEGLAEYTGYRLAFANLVDRRAAAVFVLHAGPLKGTFVRSFAYISGPAYGILLDDAARPWRKGLTVDSDLGELLARSYNIRITTPTSAAAMSLAKKYDGDELIAAETERDIAQQAKIAEFKQHFIEGPVLVLFPGESFSYGFNPNNLVSIDDSTVVYPWLRVSDAWGVLEANGGMLVRENGRIKKVVVPAAKDTNGSSLHGDDWKLELAPGWKVVAGERSGDETVKKE